MNTFIDFPLSLTKPQFSYLVAVIQDRIEQIEGTECNNPDVRLAMYAEMTALRFALVQLGVAV